MCSFNNASVMQTLESADIDYVENYVRTELSAKFPEDQINTEEKQHFFGGFVEKPSQFLFNRGERKLIGQMIEHVKLVSKSPDGLQQFQLALDSTPSKKFTKQIQLELIHTSIGLCFRKLSSASILDVVNKISLAPNDLKQSLFERVKEFFEKYAHIERKTKITEQLIEVTLMESNQIEASVGCIFCTKSSKVYCRLADDGKASWILSNLQKHIERLHVVQDKSTKSKKQEPLSNEILIAENENVLSNDDNNASQLIDESQFEIDLDKQMRYNQDILYTHIYSQQHIIKHCLNNATTMDFIVDSNELQPESNVLVKTCKVLADGNCLFLALTHQLYQPVPNGKNHKRLAKEMRQEVVLHILDNIDPFLHELKGRLLDNGVCVDANNLTFLCTQFVKDMLSQDAVYGGIETLKAVARIHKVNILIINDNKTCNLGSHFNSTYTRALVIAYKSLGTAIDRNHYDSVVAIDDDLLKQFVIQVMDLEKRSIIFHRDILDFKILEC